jgi:hypothetical protein
MPLNISNLAQGLTSLLGAKGQGAGPREFADQVVGTIDIARMLSFNQREFLVASNAAPAVGGNIFTGLSVPPGEAWLVDMFGLDCTPGAGAAIDAAPAWGVNQAAGLISLGVYAAAAATQNIRPFSSNMPLLANPGSRFGFNVRSVTLAPSVDCIIVFTRLRV